MAFRYCVYCNNNGNGMGEPTVEEDLFAGQKCPDCGQEQPQVRSPEEYLVMAFDEIKKMQKVIVKQHHRIQALMGQVEKLNKVRR